MNRDLVVYKLYIVYFAIVFIIIFLLKMGKINRKRSCIILAITLSMCLSFRSYDQGLNDTRVVYQSLFDAVRGYSFEGLVGSHYAKFTSTVFVWLIKFISIISFHEFRIFVIMSSLFFVFSFEYFIYKKCENVYLANIFFVSFIFPYGFYIIRQCMSMSFAVLSICMLTETQDMRGKRKQIIAGLVYAAFSVLIHPLSLLFYVASTLFHFFNKRNMMTLVNKIIIIVIIFVLIMPTAFTVVFKYLPEGTKYSIFIAQNHYAEGELWVAPFLIYGLFSLVLLLRYRKNNIKSDSTLLVGYALCTTMFIATTNIIQDLVRIAYFFFPMEMILLSRKDTLKISRKKNIYELMTVMISFFYCFLILLPESNIIRW